MANMRLKGLFASLGGEGGCWLPLLFPGTTDMIARDRCNVNRSLALGFKAFLHFHVVYSLPFIEVYFAACLAVFESSLLWRKTKCSWNRTVATVCWEKPAETRDDIQ